MSGTTQIPESAHIEMTNGDGINVYCDPDANGDEDAERMAFRDGYDGAVALDHDVDDDLFVVHADWCGGLSVGACILNEDGNEEIADIPCEYSPEWDDDGTKVFFADDERYTFAIELRRLEADN